MRSLALQEPLIFRRCSERTGDPIYVTFELPDHPGVGLATDSMACDRLEHRRQLEPGASDRLEHLTRGVLLIDRLGETRDRRSISR